MQNVSKSVINGALTLRLLGPPEARYADRPLVFRTRKTLALLAYLAAERAPCRRETLTALLWPEKEAGAARASLRNTLSYLHAALRAAGAEGADAYALTRGDTVALDPAAPLDLDLDALLAAAGARPGAGDEIRLLEAGLAAWRGEFLEGFAVEDAAPFDDWISMRREAWHLRLTALLDRLSALQLDRGEIAAARQTAARWVAESSLEEPAHRRLMQAHLAAGDPTAALRAYEALRGALAAELGATPAPETTALAARARAGAPATLPSAARPAPPHPRGPGVSLAVVESGVLGRGEEFGRLVALYEAACPGRAQVAILEGEAGIGKTRLAVEFLRWAAARGAEALQGRAFEAGGRVPYRPLLEILRPRLDRENAPADLLSDVWLAELGRLLPELRERYPDLPATADADSAARARLFEAVARLLEAFATRTPLVLFVDDIHWADADTLDLLHYAARRWAAAGTPVLLLLAVRAEERQASAALARWLRDLRREAPVTDLSLGPLPPDETVRLIRTLSGRQDAATDAAADRFGRWLHEETGGQPFYLIETLKALLENGLLAPAGPVGEAPGLDFAATLRDETRLRGFLPPSVQEVIRGRLARLTPAAFGLLTAGAVLGREFSFETLCAVAGLDEGAGLPALDELLAARLLRETASGEGLCVFTHDKIRAVTYSEAGAARRRLFHRRAFAALQSAQAPPGEVAQHALAAGMPEQALLAVLAAGREALRLFAVQAALNYFEQARRLVRQAGDAQPALLSSAQVEELYMQLGRAYELSGGRADLARAAYEELLAIARRAGEARLESRALNRLATRAAQDYADADQARRLLDEALRAAEVSGDVAVRAETEWNIAHTAFYSSGIGQALVHARRALELARLAGSAELTARGLNALAYAEVESYYWAEAAEHATEALTIYRTLGDRAMQVDCLCLLAKSAIAQGRVSESLALTDEALAVSRAIGNPWGEGNSGMQRTWALLDWGRYDEALRQAARCLDLVRAHRIMPLHGPVLAMMGAIHRTLGDLPEALAKHQEGLAIVEALPVQPFKTTLAAELTADYARLGDWAQAHVYARLAAATREDHLHYYSGLTYWHETAALVRGGDAQQAVADLARFGERAARGVRFMIPYRRALAELAAWRGEGAAALRELEAAATLTADLDLPGEQWDVEARIAHLCGGWGDASRAERAEAAARSALHCLSDRIADPAMSGALLDRLSPLSSAGS